MKDNLREIIVNKCYGGFSLSSLAVKRYAEIKGFKIYPYAIDHDYSKGYKIVKYTLRLLKWDLANKESCVHYVKKLVTTYEELNKDNNYFYDRDIARDDLILVQVVKEMKDKANGSYAKLEITKIPSDIEWHIEEYDGMEHVAENHRTW
jgi:hypothetical protein